MQASKTHLPHEVLVINFINFKLDYIMFSLSFVAHKQGQLTQQFKHMMANNMSKHVRSLFRHNFVLTYLFINYRKYFHRPEDSPTNPSSISAV